MPFNLSIRNSKNQLIDQNWMDLICSLEFILLDIDDLNSNWIQYQIIFKTPQKEILFQSKDYLLGIKPVNELQLLMNSLTKFISSDQIHFRFEPIETNFEIVVERSRQDINSFKLFCWIDNGNAELTHYTWDSLGLRIHTSTEEIQHFISQIEKYISTQQLRQYLDSVNNYE